MTTSATKSGKLGRAGPDGGGRFSMAARMGGDEIAVVVIVVVRCICAGRRSRVLNQGVEGFRRSSTPY
jgi:hypothetical protein